jgi:prephenate dehydratase
MVIYIMADKLNILKFKKSEFPDISDVEKERTLGKLQILEVLAEMIQNFRETYTRLLVVNEVEPTDENTSKDSNNVCPISENPVKNI